MATTEVSLVDKLVQKILPIIGVLFIVGGIAYLFYTGLWGIMDKTARLGFGFFVSVAFIGSGFGLQNRLKQFSDVIIGGGILIFYITLIFWSRFDSTSSVLIPELASLAIAVIFAIAVSYFAYIRNSKTILGLGIIGAYMTPFFLGKQGVWDFALSYNSFLVYFLWINIALFLSARKIFLKDIILFNSIGLFASSASMNYLYTSGQINQISLVLFIAIVWFSIYALANTSQAFEKHENTYFAFGALLPLIWFIGNLLLSAHYTSAEQCIAFGVVALIYFGAWYALRDSIKKQEYIALYMGGIISILMMILSLQEQMQDYIGLVIGALGLVFGALYLINPLKQRLMTFFGMSFIGGLVNVIIFGPEYGLTTWNPYIIIMGFIPLMSGFVIAKRATSPDKEVLNVFATFASIISGLILLNRLYIHLDIPASFIFLTVPALVITASIYISPGAKEKELNIFAFVLCILGYFATFFILLDRIYPAPVGILPFHTRESLIGISSALIFFGLAKKQRENAQAEKKEPNFFYILMAVVSVLLIVNHELITSFNYIDISAIDQKVFGFRALTTTLWWVSLASYLIYRGTKVLNYKPEKILGLVLLGITILKIVFYDLTHVNTNLKVFILIIVGGIMLGISYYANRQEQK